MKKKTRVKKCYRCKKYPAIKGIKVMNVGICGLCADVLLTAAILVEITKPKKK